MHTHKQPKKVKNISYDTFGTKVGRVHMQRQDFGKLQTRKLKGLKRSHGDKELGSSETKKLRLQTWEDAMNILVCSVSICV